MSTEAVSRCALHEADATGVCARCGRFGCGECLSKNGEPWCTQCLARPEARLTPSAASKRALWMALLGFHGVVVLLPFAAWAARSELQAISRGESPAAGRPWAQGALALAAVGTVIWFLLLMWVT